MMPHDASAQILVLWEQGVGRHPLDRALLLLQGMQPDMTLSALADMVIGQRDQMLLTLRARLFGRELPGYVDCPECKTRLEFVFDIDTFRSEIQCVPIEVDGIRIRQPTSRDLASVINIAEPDRAAYHLAQRCCSLIEKQGMVDELPTLSATELAKIEASLAEIDAATDIVLNFACDQCGHAWQTAFDINDYLWREIEKHASQLLNQIHTIARAYGWNEPEILALSEARRLAYLERVWG